MIVRQFTLGGKQAGAFLPRSSFPKGLVPGTGPRIEATPDRVGVLAYSGGYSGNMGPDREWVELDMSGKIVERLPVDGAMKSPASVAFTADDHVYLYGGRQSFTLDTASHSWKSTPKEEGWLAGADGNNLVYRQAWHPPPVVQSTLGTANVRHAEYIAATS